MRGHFWLKEEENIYSHTCGTGKEYLLILEIDIVIQSLAIHDFLPAAELDDTMASIQAVLQI